MIEHSLQAALRDAYRMIPPPREVFERLYSFVENHEYGGIDPFKSIDDRTYFVKRLVKVGIHSLSRYRDSIDDDFVIKLHDFAHQAAVELAPNMARDTLRAHLMRDAARLSWDLYHRTKAPCPGIHTICDMSSALDILGERHHPKEIEYAGNLIKTLLSRSKILGRDLGTKSFESAARERLKVFMRNPGHNKSSLRKLEYELARIGYSF